jgi:hypothetical protein
MPNNRMVRRSMSGLSASRQPLFQHEQGPDHGAVIGGMLGLVAAQQLVDEFAAHDAASLETFQAVASEFSQAAMLHQPEPEGQAEALFLLGSGSPVAGIPAAPP